MWKSIVLIILVFIVLQSLLFLYKTNSPSAQTRYRRPRPNNNIVPLSTVADPNETSTWMPLGNDTPSTRTRTQGPESRCGYSLKWTSLKAGTDNDTAFFSAYYDERKGAPNRPAVIVLGYHMKSLKNPDLRCVFTFQNGTSACSSKRVAGIGKSCINIHDDGKMATSYTYICPLSCAESRCNESEIPLSVAMSTGANCEGKSEMILVQDCRLLKEVELKKRLLGVCPSPVYKLGRQDIIEFIEMNKALGVDLVSLYLMPGLDENMIQYLQERYSKDGVLDLEMFQWREMYMHKILHYNGQLLAICDCMYRNMYRVEYLIVTDLDELIIPFKHKNYMDMINSFKASSDTHSYRFLNRFFAINASQPPTLPDCNGLTLSKYFHRINQLKCVYNINFRPKYIMRPQLVVQIAVHGVCQVVKGGEYRVSPKNAILGHFRNSIPDDCKDRRTTKQVALLKYQSRVTQQMCT